MTEQTYIEKIEEMREKGSCRTSPASARVYAAQLRAGSPLCLAAAADEICENGESLLELDGKEALDRLNRWQAEKLLSDKERAALKLLLKIHNIEPFSRRTAERLARHSFGTGEKSEKGITTLKPFLLREMREEAERNQELPVSLYNILSALRQVTKNRREVAEVPAYTLLMRALLLNDGFIWNSDVTEQELRPGGSHFEENIQVIENNLQDPVLRRQVKEQLAGVLVELEDQWDGPQMRIDVGRACGWLEADMEKRLWDSPAWRDDYEGSCLRLLLRRMASMEKGLCGFLYREMEAEDLAENLMKLIRLSIEAAGGIWTPAPAYEEKKRQVSPEAVLFLTAAGCGVPIEPGFWRKKEWKETVLSLLEADLLLPDGKNLRAAEGAEQEGFLELWKAAGEESGQPAGRVWQLLKTFLTGCSIQGLEKMERHRAQHLRLHVKSLLGHMDLKEKERISFLTFLTRWLWADLDGEDGKAAVDAARWILLRMKEEPENMDSVLREILKTSPKDQAIRLDRSSGTCLLEGELTSQCAQRYLQLALEEEELEESETEAAESGGKSSKEAYWAACALSQAEKARRQFQRLGAGQLEKETGTIAELARQMLPPDDSLTDIQVMNRSEKRAGLFLPWYSSIFDSTLSSGPECTQERTEASLLQILLSGQRIVLSLNQMVDNEKIRNLAEIPAFLWMLRRGLVSVSMMGEVKTLKEYALSRMRNPGFVWSSLPEDFEQKQMREAAARWLDGSGSLRDLPEEHRDRMVRFRDAVELMDENLPGGWTAWNHQGSEYFLKERGIGQVISLRQRLLAYYNTPNPGVEGFETMKQLNRIIAERQLSGSRSAYRRAVWAVMKDDDAALKEMGISADVTEALKEGGQTDLLENMIRISDICYNQMLGERISPYQNYVYNEETARLLPEWNQVGRRLVLSGGEPVSDAGRMFYRQLDTDISGRAGGDPAVSWEQAAQRILDMEKLADEMPGAGAEQLCSRLLQQGLDEYGVFGQEGNLRLQKLIFRASTGRTMKREQTGGGNLYHEEVGNIPASKQPPAPK